MSGSAVGGGIYVENMGVHFFIVLCSNQALQSGSAVGDGPWAQRNHKDINNRESKGHEFSRERIPSDGKCSARGVREGQGSPAVEHLLILALEHLF